MPLLCDRTREWVALRLDAELSEFEMALMTAHLEWCEGCRAFSTEVEGITAALRGAPLELPARRVALPVRRHLPTRRLQIVAAAAVVVVAAGLGGVFGTLSAGSGKVSGSEPARSPMLSSVSPDAFLRNLRLLSLRQSANRGIGATKPVLRASA